MGIEEQKLRNRYYMEFATHRAYYRSLGINSVDELIRLSVEKRRRELLAENARLKAERATMPKQGIIQSIINKFTNR